MSATADQTRARTPDLARLRALAARRTPGTDIWRSLDELCDTDDFRAYLENEFPSLAQLTRTAPDRRTVLKLMGASLAMAGLTACNEAEKIVPYVRQPENVIPGKPRHYATTLSSQGYGIGAVVESHEGRPTKVEGNPDHPSSRGATDAIMQASVLALFDPQRSRTPLKNGGPVSADDFLARMAQLSARLDSDRGSGTALLVETSTSPTLHAQLDALRRRYPLLRVYRHDPLAGDGKVAASRALFGRELVPRLRLDRADVIVSLDADFLGEGPGRLAHARDFADRRRVRGPADTMSRLYAIESTPTITGAAADHRFACPPCRVEALAAELENAIGQGGGAPSSPSWWASMAADIQAAGARAAVVAGSHQPAFVHEAALAMNVRLGALGKTVEMIEPPHRLRVDGGMLDLATAIASGDTRTLLVLGANPAHTAPADIDIRDAFSHLEELIHWGMYVDETARLAHWHVPAAHELESWSDLRGHDGTASIVQPLIHPLFGGRTTHEILAALAGDFNTDARALVRETWRDRLDDRTWNEALKAGVVAGSAASPVALSDIEHGARSAQARPTRDTKPAAADSIEIRFVPDPWLRDGRYADLAWLQELPRPLTKLVWGNAALISPSTADRLGVENGRIMVLTKDDYRLEAPAWILPGHPDDTLTLSFGFGRIGTGEIGALASGYDAFRLRRTETPWLMSGVAVEVTGRSDRLITTQHHHSMEGRDIVRRASLAEFRDDPHFAREGAPPPEESVYPEWDYDEEAWGMSIDLTACIGCMACVSACQAENNIATVGPDECAVGHEMHWLRVDRYYAGPPDAPETLFQPVPCMHCEKAPCEVVCPVNATVHTHDGLNAQVYNRCIGTRYCSQNCPYKVRRFNFLEYQEFDRQEAGIRQAIHNPDVSVRSRGVMEKCTYCVQRIAEKRIAAQRDNRAIAVDEVVTACQQACPTQAISFGDLNKPDSKVVADKHAPHDYTLLAELNTRPRTTYLAKIANPASGQTGEDNSTDPERGDG